MKTHKHVLFWLAAIFVCLFIAPAGVTPEYARKRVQMEHQAVVGIFGVDTANAMTKRTNATYDLLINKTGIGPWMSQFYTTEEQINSAPIAQDTQRSVGSTFNRYLWSASTLFYGLVLRLNVVAQWVVYVGFFLLAAVMDGQAQRKIKYECVITISPAKYSIALHAVIAMLFVPILYMVLPVHISPWFTPIWVMVIALPLSKAVANASGFD